MGNNHRHATNTAKTKVFELIFSGSTYFSTTCRHRTSPEEADSFTPKTTDVSTICCRHNLTNTCTSCTEAVLRHCLKPAPP